MSSELIGELGQVGLTIGEPMAQHAVDDEENQVMDDGLSDDSAVSGPTIKRSRVSSTRPKRFRSQWMMFDIFKDWLRPHPNPELASCIVCSRVIKAGKSELEKHATGKRHLKMLKEQQGIVLVNSGNTSGDLETFTLDGWSVRIDDEGFNNLVETVTVLAGQESKQQKNEDFPRVKGLSRRKVQRYRKAWEEVPEFSLWLSAHPDPYKAICQLCDRIMTADITVIRQHAISKRHLWGEQTYYQNRQRPSEKTKDAPRDIFDKAIKEAGVDLTAESGSSSGNDGKHQYIMYRDVEHQYSAEQHEAGTDMSAVEGAYATGISYVPAQERVVQPTAEVSRNSPSKLF
ncbi:hypothetical protein GE061_016961, partial [Apolygus lucorum]